MREKEKSFVLWCIVFSLCLYSLSEPVIHVVWRIINIITTVWSVIGMMMNLIKMTK